MADPVNTNAIVNAVIVAYLSYGWAVLAVTVPAAAAVSALRDRRTRRAADRRPMPVTTGDAPSTG